jgi:subtilisin family serine protease
LLLLCTVGAVNQAQTQQRNVDVIISTSKPYNNVVAAIQGQGGAVKWQYKYIDAISARIPSSALPAVRDLVGEDAISKDIVISAPKPVKDAQKTAKVSVLADSDIYTVVPVGKSVGKIFPVKAPGDVPPEKAYAVNDANLQIRNLHAAGFTGKNVVVAVVDSGVRPGYASLELDGSIIGGEDFVSDGRGFSNPTNDPHGTFVAGLISGNARFPVLDPSTFLSSLKTNFPGTLESSKAGTFLDMIGTAPEAQIYAVRIFGVPAAAGAPLSRVIAAVESVIDLRQNFDKYGQFSPTNPRGGYNIKVCNMSFGVLTMYAGHTPLEQEIDEMAANDIVPVVGAGDAGASSLTISSPATAFSALAVGATNPSGNDRLFNDFVDFSDLGCTGLCGAQWRPSKPTQTAFFSSRGPTADGRILPDVMAAGNGMLSQGCGGFDLTGTCQNDVNNLTMGAGTSFSAPVVSGISAVLRQEFPKASVGQIWNAIVNTANNKLLGDDSTVIDQGQGLVNASAAAELLQDGKVSDKLPKPPQADSLVSNNIEDGTDLRVVSGTLSQRMSNLKPGERGEILYHVDPTTSQVVINLTNVNCGGSPCGNRNPGANQNMLFGDDVVLQVQTAKTSFPGLRDYFPCPSFNNTVDTTIVIPDPSCGIPERLEPGVIRITLMGDSTNLGVVSANVGVSSSRSPLPATTAEGKIRGGDNLVFQISLPPTVSTSSSLKFQLRWDQDWGHYPTNDLDMHITDPTGAVNLSGATLNSPEEVVVSAIPGTWQINVIGFYVPSKQDNFVLSVLLDGKLVTLVNSGKDKNKDN